MKERQERDASIKPADLKKPVPPSIYQLGSDDDPCFGKLYDPSDATCRICGDIELCGIVFSKNLKSKRDDIEKENEFMDVEEITESTKKIQAFVKKKIDAKVSPERIRSLIKKKFHLSESQIKQYI